MRCARLRALVRKVQQIPVARFRQRRESARWDITSLVRPCMYLFSQPFRIWFHLIDDHHAEIYFVANTSNDSVGVFEAHSLSGKPPAGMVRNP